MELLASSLRDDERRIYLHMLITVYSSFNLSAPIMGYERFIFWFWESQTTGWHACKVKKHFHFLIICIYFYLFVQRLPNNSFFQTPPVIGWVHLKQCLWAFTAPKASPSGKEWICIFIHKWAGNMLMFHDDINMKRLGTRFKNDSIQWFRVDSFFWETITLYTVHFQI